MVLLEFSAKVVTGRREQVFVVGNCKELGSWRYNHAIKLVHSQTGEPAESHWSGFVDVTSTLSVEYRYFVGKLSQNEADDPSLVLVQRWEGGPTARVVSLSDGESHRLTDIFGNTASKPVLYPGWLTRQTEVRLHVNGSSFISLGKMQPASHGYRIKCLPLDLTQEHLDPPENQIGSNLDSILYLDLAGEKIEYSEQPKFGVLLKPESLVTYSTQTTAPDNLAIRIGVYKCNTAGVAEDVTLVGHSLVIPANLSESSQGALQLPVIGADLKTRGQIILEYLVVRPLPTLMDNLGASTALHWQHQPGTVDMGHRGMGKCRAKCIAPYYKENTIKSFNQAASYGVDYVEFDVQLTKDNIPVVFHDFFCRLPCASINSNENTWHDVEVMTMTYKQLTDIQVEFSGQTGLKEKVVDGEADSMDDHYLFPTLVEVLSEVHPALGFNLEVKYPMKLDKTGKLEEDILAFMDMNEYLDVILECLLSGAGKRNIVLASFSPDVCVMLRLKQNRWPVSLLTQCTAERYNQYQDRRTRKLDQTFIMAKAEHFLGVNPISEFILKDLDLIRKAHDLDLVLMCWGSENTDREVVRKLKDHDLDAVIFDKVDEMIDPSKYGRYTNTSISTHS